MNRFTNPYTKLLLLNGVVIIIALVINFFVIRWWTKGEIESQLIEYGLIAYSEDGTDTRMDYKSLGPVRPAPAAPAAASSVNLSTQVAALATQIASADIVRYSHNFKITQPGSEGAGSLAVTGQAVIRWQEGGGQRWNLTR